MRYHPNHPSGYITRAIRLRRDGTIEVSHGGRWTPVTAVRAGTKVAAVRAALRGAVLPRACQHAASRRREQIRELLDRAGLPLPTKARTWPLIRKRPSRR